MTIAILDSSQAQTESKQHGNLSNCFSSAMVMVTVLVNKEGLTAEQFEVAKSLAEAYVTIKCDDHQKWFGAPMFLQRLVAPPYQTKEELRKHFGAQTSHAKKHMCPICSNATSNMNEADLAKYQKIWGPRIEEKMVVFDGADVSWEEVFVVQTSKTCDDDFCGDNGLEAQVKTEEEVGEIKKIVKEALESDGEVKALLMLALEKLNGVEKSQAKLVAKLKRKGAISVSSEEFEGEHWFTYDTSDAPPGVKTKSWW